MKKYLIFLIIFLIVISFLAYFGVLKLIKTPPPSQKILPEEGSKWLTKISWWLKQIVEAVKEIFKDAVETWKDLIKKVIEWWEGKVQPKIKQLIESRKSAVKQGLKEEKEEFKEGIGKILSKFWEWLKGWLRGLLD